MKDISIAAVNFRAKFGQIEANLARIEAWVARLAGRGVEMACFPEMSISGYDHTEAIRPLAQSIPGPATDRLVAIARRHSLTVLAGLPELPATGSAGRDRLYVSHVIATPSGLAGIYRKGGGDSEE